MGVGRFMGMGQPVATTAAEVPAPAARYLRCARDGNLELVVAHAAAGTAVHEAALKEQARRAEIRKRITATRLAYLEWAAEHPQRAEGCTSPR